MTIRADARDEDESGRDATDVVAAVNDIYYSSVMTTIIPRRTWVVWLESREEARLVTGSRGLPGFGFLGPDTLAVELQDRGVMHQPVYGRHGRQRVLEDLVPFREHQGCS